MMAALDEARFWAVHFGGYVTLIEGRGSREPGRRGLQTESDEGVAASLREDTVFEDGAKSSEIFARVRRRKRVRHIMSRIGLGLIGFVAASGASVDQVDCLLRADIDIGHIRRLTVGVFPAQIHVTILALR